MKDIFTPRFRSFFALIVVSLSKLLHNFGMHEMLSHRYAPLSDFLSCMRGGGGGFDHIRECCMQWRS
jgi:hypothetical protein